MIFVDDAEFSGEIVLPASISGEFLYRAVMFEDPAGVFLDRAIVAFAGIIVLGVRKQ